LCLLLLLVFTHLYGEKEGGRESVSIISEKRKCACFCGKLAMENKRAWYFKKGNNTNPTNIINNLDRSTTLVIVED